MAGAKRMAVEDLVDMTAMVDIVFFVLIFFMVTSMEGVYSSIEMPSPDPQKVATSGKRSVTDFQSDKEYVIVRIDKDNVLWLNDTEVASQQELLVRLRDIRQSNSSLNKLLVLTNSEAKHGRLVEVLDAGSDVGMEHVQWAIDDES
ncbi:MAG: biopolymer transporter ExbD [Thermoguttaceae bacterium]|jgi:biopolymer transport protein ExbD